MPVRICEWTIADKNEPHTHMRHPNTLIITELMVIVTDYCWFYMPCHAGRHIEPGSSQPCPWAHLTNVFSQKHYIARKCSQSQFVIAVNVFPSICFIIFVDSSIVFVCTKHATDECCLAVFTFKQPAPFVYLFTFSMCDPHNAIVILSERHLNGMYCFRFVYKCLYNKLNDTANNVDLLFEYYLFDM